MVSKIKPTQTHLVSRPEGQRRTTKLFPDVGIPHQKPSLKELLLDPAELQKHLNKFEGPALKQELRRIAKAEESSLPSLQKLPGLMPKQLSNVLREANAKCATQKRLDRLIQRYALGPLNLLLRNLESIHNYYSNESLFFQELNQNEFGQVVQKHLKQGLHPDYTFPDNHPHYRNMTLAQVAIMWNNPKLLELLLDKKANPNDTFPPEHPHYPNLTLAEVAAWQGNLEVVTLLLNKGATLDPNYRFPNYHQEYPELSLAQVAILQGNPALLELLLKRGATLDPNYRFPTNQQGYLHMTLAQVAFWQGNLKLLELLLDKKANPNDTFPPEHPHYPNLTLAELAAWQGNLEVVTLLLNKGATLDPNYSFPDYHQGYPKMTLTQVAILQGNLELLKLLLKNGANPNSQFLGNRSDFPYLTSLAQMAILKGNLELLKLLLDHKANPNDAFERDNLNYPDMTLAQAAVWQGNEKLLELLFQAGATLDLNYTFPDDHPSYPKMPLVEVAIIWNNPKLLELLLKNGASPDSKFRPEHLHYPNLTLAQVAVLQGNPDLLKLLLDNKADLNILFPGDHPYYPKQTLVEVAIMRKDLKLLELLLDKKVDIDSPFPDDHPRYPKLTLAQVEVLHGNPALLELLLDKKANPNDTFPPEHSHYPNLTLAQVAARQGNLEIVTLLLKRRATLDPNYTFPDNHPSYPKMTLAQVAVLRRNSELRKLLLNRGAVLDLNYRFPDNHPSYPKMTLAQVAVIQSNTALLELLLDRGATLDPNCRFPDNHPSYPKMTLAQVAVIQSNPALLELLLDRGATLDPNYRFPDNHPSYPKMTLVQVAVLVNNKAILRELLKRNVDLPNTARVLALRFERDKPSVSLKLVEQKINDMLAIVESDRTGNSWLKDQLIQLREQLPQKKPHEAMMGLFEIMDFSTNFEDSLQIAESSAIPREFGIERLNQVERVMTPEYYPFYHAMGSQGAIACRVLSTFLQSLTAENRIYLRNMMSEKEVEKASEFVKHSEIDTDPLVSAKMLSVVYNLFDNSSVESAMYFLRHKGNIRIKSDEVLRKMLDMLVNLKVITLERVDAYIKAIEDFDKATLSNFGALLQILIRHDQVNELGYASLPVGVPLRDKPLKETVDDFRLESQEGRPVPSSQARILLTNAFYLDPDAVVIKTYFSPEYEKKLEEFYASRLLPMILEDVVSLKEKSLSSFTPQEKEPKREARLKRSVRFYDEVSRDAHQEAITRESREAPAVSSNNATPPDPVVIRSATQHAFVAAQLKEQGRGETHKRILRCLASVFGS